MLRDLFEVRGVADRCKAETVPDMPARLPWPADFPDVVVHTTVRERDGHPAYASAKAGDAEAALTLAVDLFDPICVEALRSLIGDRPALLLPVIAEETLGFNAILTRWHRYSAATFIGP